MNIVSAIVVYAVLWFLTLFVILPIHVRTQDEDNDVVPGTPGSAPTNSMIRPKMIWTTAIATLLWAIIVAVIVWGGITMKDLDFWARFRP